MRRILLAVSASILLAAALPAATLAFVSDVQDQHNDGSPEVNLNTSYTLAQTFTSGKTGLLNRVQLEIGNSASGSMGVAFCPMNGANPVSCVAFSQTATPTMATGWFDFYFSYPQPVVKGTKYAVEFTLNGLGGVPVISGFNTDYYTGGDGLAFISASWQSPAPGFHDFAFRTFVVEQTTSLGWSLASVAAGASTPLTLTETITFPSYAGTQPLVIPNQPDAVWTVKTDSVPSWFTPSGVTCSAQIAPADCTLANADPGGTIPVTPDGSPITIVLSGTAHPGSGDVGSVNGTAEGCVGYTQGPVTSCVSALASISVSAAATTPGPTTTPPPTPAATTTPPPTSSGGSPGDSSDGASESLVLAAIAAAAAAILLGWRRRGVLD